MTENQEKELFTTLATLVTGVQVIQSDVQEMKKTLNEHSQVLKRLDAKTDTIAGTVLNHEGRLTKAEDDIKELQGGIY